MIILNNQHNKSIGKMVNSETPAEYTPNSQKESFEYQVPRVRASFALRAAPDSTTADLPEQATSTTSNSNTNNHVSSGKYNVGLISSKISLPEYGPHLPTLDPDTKQPKNFRPQAPTQHSLITSIPRIPKSMIPNRSSHISNDDKEFEIPLEESLKAVEEFIAREKELSKWSIGEDVLAKWKGNGLFYKAKIMEILPSGIVLVLFDTYDITEEVDYKELCKFFKKTNSLSKKGKVKGKLKEETEKKSIMRGKKHIKPRKIKTNRGKKIRFISVFKKSDIIRKKKILNYKKSKNQHLTKSNKLCLAKASNLYWKKPKIKNIQRATNGKKLP